MVLNELNPFGDFVVQRLGIRLSNWIKSLVRQIAVLYLHRKQSQLLRETVCQLGVSMGQLDTCDPRNITEHQLEPFACHLLGQIQLLLVEYFRYNWHQQAAIISQNKEEMIQCLRKGKILAKGDHCEILKGMTVPCIDVDTSKLSYWHPLPCKDPCRMMLLFLYTDFESMSRHYLNRLCSIESICQLHPDRVSQDVTVSHDDDDDDILPMLVIDVMFASVFMTKHFVGETIPLLSTWCISCNCLSLQCKSPNIVEEFNQQLKLQLNDLLSVTICMYHQRPHRLFVELFPSIESSSHFTQNSLNHCSSLFSGAIGFKTEQAPCLILLGGGMAVGKSTALERLAHGRRLKGMDPFLYPTHDDDDRLVIINADWYKPMFVKEMELSTISVESPEFQNVHRRSTEEAEHRLVSALNFGQSVIFDGTMSWRPFVEQVIELARRAQHFIHKRGPGYQPTQGIEEYFRVSQRREIPLSHPFRIIFLSFFVNNPAVAVRRSLLRELNMGRAVPIPQLLRSHQLFAIHFETLASLCDDVLLFDALAKDTETGKKPQCVKQILNGEILMEEKSAMETFCNLATINIYATNATEI